MTAKREIHAANADEGCAISARITRVVKVQDVQRPGAGGADGGRDEDKANLRNSYRLLGNKLMGTKSENVRIPLM